MKINSTIVISLLVLFFGFFFDQPYLWVPLSVLMAGFVDLFAWRWISSDHLGTWITFSVLLKFFFALIGFYAMIGQIVCVCLILWWFIF